MHWLVWLSVGIVFAILEVFTPGFFLLGIGVSMAVSAIPAALSSPLYVQILTFGISTLAFFLLVRPIVMKIPSKGKKSGMEALCGKEGIVTERIEPLKGGRVRVGGEDWKAVSEEKVEKGEIVIVVKIEGVTLTVRRK